MIERMTTHPSNKRRLGILICGHSPDNVINVHGPYNTIFEKLLGHEQYSYRAYTVVDNEFPASIDEADAWLISGSKHGAYEAFDWIAPLETFIRQVYAKGLPMVGICFGHQILAQSLGGKVVKHKDGWVVGTQHYKFCDETGMEDVVLNAWHQDQVVELPKDGRVIGSSDTCEFAAIAYGDHTVSLQGHPEFENDYVKLLLTERGWALPPDRFQNAIDSLDQKLTNRSIATWLNSVLSGEVLSGEVLPDEANQ